MESTIVNGILELVILFIVFISILIAAYYFTKKIAQFKQGSTRGHNMNVLEVLPLAVGKNICIVKIGEEYHLFTTSKDHIQHCGKIEKNHLNILQNNGQDKSQGEVFREIFLESMKRKQEKDHEGSKK